jgi:hypothetical protein
MQAESEKPAPRVKFTRRAIGTAVCLSPILLLLASVVFAQSYPRESALGVGLSVVGLLVGILNFHLAVVRPSLYVWRHGSREGMRNVSGFPIVGTFLVVLGGAIGFGDWQSPAVGLVALTIDIGGLPWFLVATWRDRSFWDD